MSRLTQQLTRSAFKNDLEEFVSDKYEFIPYLNKTFNLSVEHYPSLKKYLHKPLINLLTLEENFSLLEKDIYSILLKACLKNHDQAVAILSLVYNTSEGRNIAMKVYRDFFETHHYIDFLLGGNTIQDEFNIQIDLTPQKALTLIRLLIASANK